jgi:hypothetical protein
MANRQKKDYKATSEAYLRSNSLILVKTKDYLGQETVKIIGINELSKPKARGF